MKCEREQIIDYRSIDPDILRKLLENEDTEGLCNGIKGYELAQKMLSPAEQFINCRLVELKETCKFIKEEVHNRARPNFKIDSFMCVHFVPLVDMISKPHLSIQEIERLSAQIKLGDKDKSPSIFRANLYGYVAKYYNWNKSIPYTQVFRNSCIETVYNVLADHEKVQVNNTPKDVFFPKYIYEFLSHSIVSQTKLLRKMEVSPPILIQTSLFGVKDSEIYYKHSELVQMCTYDEDELYLLPSIIFEYNKNDNYQSVISEQLDYFWNVFGMVKCDHLNMDGTFKA